KSVEPAHAPSASGRVEEQVHRGGETPPALDFPTECPASGAGARVVARPPVVLGDLPLAGDETLTFETLQCRIQRSLVHLERAAGDLPDALPDPPAVLRLQGERLEHHEIDRTACVGLAGGGHAGAF